MICSFLEETKPPTRQLLADIQVLGITPVKAAITTPSQRSTDLGSSSDVEKCGLKGSDPSLLV
jgi:hypothetical protein